MRRWWVSLVVAMVATGSAIAVNVATDGQHHLWAWVAVGVLTLAGAGTTVWLHRLDSCQDSLPNGSAGPGNSERPGAVHNEVHGAVDGSVVQARVIQGSVTVTDRSRRVNQTAVGSDHAVIQQAGGDIHNGDNPQRRYPGR